MTDKLRLGHDGYFRRQFSRLDFAHDFFQDYLPEKIRGNTDWKVLRLAPGDFVGKALRNRRSDILYETKIDGRNSLFYIHLEHQRTSDRKMAYRMLVYMVNIWEQYRVQYPGKDLPLVFPMVIYQGRTGWTAP
ncbi:MAG: Rpn family recombination-promoting nuclease/putative transposase [Proteobacteria bacterium]|nr:Rpn family recombination-promoting nuclease/putative transposase [Pseudomonadota bacterium]